MQMMDNSQWQRWQRSTRVAINWMKFSPMLLRMHLLPQWVYWSLAANGMLAIALFLSLARPEQFSTPPAHLSTAATASVLPPTPPLQLRSTIQLGIDRVQRAVNYQQSLHQLQNQAKSLIDYMPSQEEVVILVGDSISQGFPPHALPSFQVLNQGISGETSGGLLKRLNLFDQVKTRSIFVMIGINDILRGKPDEEILDNQRQIIRHLQAAHPQTKIVIQSILPHATEQVTWEGRDRLLAIPNARIRNLNAQLRAIAQSSSVEYLDLYPLFSTEQGDLRPELSTDGLHLNAKGYELWGIILQVFEQEEH